MNESLRHHGGQASKVLPIFVWWRSKSLVAVALLATTAFNQTRSQESSAKNPATSQTMQTNEKKFGLVIHGGAGTIERSKMTPEGECEYRAGLERALAAGYEILKRGGSSLDATEAAVRVLEDDPHFNAGKGAVFTSAGTNELDAAIMDGKTLKAGTVASLKHIKNPVSLARLVMEKSGHVMMDGEGAETLSIKNISSRRNDGTRSRKSRKLKEAAASVKKNSLLPIKIDMARWARSRLINKGISRPQHRQVVRQTNGRGELAIHPLLAVALTRTMRPARSRPPAMANISFARLRRTTFPP